MLVCRQCGKEMQNNWITDICIECARVNVRKIFNENPEIKQAFRKSIGEMKNPENMKKMVDDTVRFMQTIQDIQKAKRE